MADHTADRKKAMAAVEAMFERYRILADQRPRDHVDFDREVMDNLKLVDASLADVMHGGAAGVIFDMATTTALCPVAKPGYWEFMGGVTRSLNISYLKAVPIGIKVRLSSRAVSVGKQMAMIRGDMTSLDGKVTYCTVEHHKVNVPVQEQHRKVRLAWDEEFEKEWKEKEHKQKAKI